MGFGLDRPVPAAHPHDHWVSLLSHRQVNGYKPLHQVRDPRWSVGTGALPHAHLIPHLPPTQLAPSPPRASCSPQPSRFPSQARRQAGDRGEQVGEGRGAGGWAGGPATSWRWESLLKVVLSLRSVLEGSGICFPVGPPYRDGAAQPNSAFTPPLPPPPGL